MPFALRDSLAPAPAACGSGGKCAMHVRGRDRLRPFERSMHRSRCRTACGPAFAGRWPAAPARLVVGDSHVVGGDAQAGPDAVKAGASAFTPWARTKARSRQRASQRHRSAAPSGTACSGAAPRCKAPYTVS